MEKKINVIEFDRELVIAKIANSTEEQFTEAQTRIGTGTPGNETSKGLIAHVPLTAQITSIKAFLRNSAWPDGCALGNSDWHEAYLDHYHEPIGWAYAGHLTRGTTEHSQWVTIDVVNWSHCNPRFGMLRVYYKLPSINKDEINFLSVDNNLLSKKIK